jgi:hypothetical protein
MERRQEPPDYDVVATWDDIRWQVVGKGWLTEDGSILFLLEWSPELTFKVVKIRTKGNLT